MTTEGPRSDMVPVVVLSICLCFCLTPFVSGETQHCLDISNDVQYKPEEMEGTWYPVEIVLHRNDSKIYGVPLDTQCPAVTFSLSKNKKILTMVWNSTEGDLEYKFQQRAKGQWQASGYQGGSLVTEGYKHFGGVLNVFKLDGDYMFLSYCSKKYDLLNSVAFSHESGALPQEVLDETLKELEDRKIKRLRNIRVTCGQEEGDTGGDGHMIVSSCLLSILPSLVVRFAF